MLSNVASLVTLVCSLIDGHASPSSIKISGRPSEHFLVRGLNAVCTHSGHVDDLVCLAFPTTRKIAIEGPYSRPIRSEG